MGTFLQDLRFAWRNLRRTPAFPLAAIATLALGIGATTAIFSTVNAVILRPLPYPHPEDLYSIRTTLTDGRVTSGLLSPVEILRLNDPALSIARAAGLGPNDVTLLRDDGAPLRTQVYAVSEGFFEIFGLPMTLGGFTHDNYTQDPQNTAPVAIISYQVWQDLYHGDPAVVGKPLRFAEITTTVAGVAPRAFDTPHGANFWFNLPLDPQGVNHNFEGFLRLKPGTTIERARSEMSGVMAGLARDFPVSDNSRVYLVRPLAEFIVGDLGPILIVVLSATALLLVLACVNVTNLLLARGAARAREMAVRVALGAHRGRIVRQLLTESLLLATVGAGVGMAAAYAGIRALLRIGAAKLPRLDTLTFDSRVLLFALVALVVSGVLVGFAPALRLAATDVKTLMNESGRSASGGRGTARWLGVMTVAEIALAVTLVAGAGWLIRSFANLRTIDLGFAAENRVLFDVTLQGSKFRDPASVIAANQDLLERLRALPNAAGVGASSNFPLRGGSGQENSLFVELHGEPMDPAHPLNSRQRSAGPGFFDAMGIKVLAGRDFSAEDRQTPPVVIVNRAFARRYLTGKDPFKTRFAYGYPTIDTNTESTIVGIVDDVRMRSIAVEPEPAFYTAQSQGPFRRYTMVVHSKTPEMAALRSAIRDEVRKTDPQMAVEFEDASEVVRATLSRQELGMTLMLLFGAAAVALAAVGIYGVIAYAASQRRGEVATRLALGATSGSVFWLVLKQGQWLTMIGAAIGLLVAYLGGRVVASQLYEVRASDPVILGGAMALVVAIALLATIIPAYRASRIDPSRVLRPD
ncbi:MAG TPA: ABC transporter permease [Vicinamibacterales bacterium]|nr:ABC transporter permease [Vicinamibacterales bacterium]